MILSQITYLDCLIFVVLLVPQLIIHVGPVQTVLCALQTAPFLGKSLPSLTFRSCVCAITLNSIKVLKLPLQLLKERILTPTQSRSPFVQRTSLFQDLVIRCVRYAFANIPASIGAVFFSKHVALPFMRFRMLRHGYARSPLHYSSVRTETMTGVWIIGDPQAPPDVVVFYCHGGGFSMGSSYFYLEFLIAWLSLLKRRQGYQNPAIFALDYTLVPKASFPAQLHECKAGYDFVLSKLPDNNHLRLCLAGDSAGATLILSLLLFVARENIERAATPRPVGFVTMISPWCRLLSELNEDTQSDYLNSDSLHLYARQYIGDISSNEHVEVENSNDPIADVKHSSSYQLASPGDCKDLELWRAIPARGYHFIFGGEEVFAPETEICIRRIKKAGGQVDVTKEPEVHAWPIVNLFLGNNIKERLRGLDRIVDVMGRNMVI